MKHKSVNILGTRIDCITKSDLIKRVSDSLLGGKKLKITKVNTEFLHRALHDSEYKKLLNSSDISIADGRGVLWVARFLTLPISSNKIIRPIQAVWQMIYSGASIMLKPKFTTYPIPEVMPGIEAFNMMMKAASDSKVGAFIFGAPQVILTQAVKNVAKSFPDLKISGSLNGYDFWKYDSIKPLDIINKTDARMLIVAMGSPKQERWIKDNMDKLKNVQVAVGEGGTLTRIAKPKQKAPRIVSKLGIEWLWRTLFNMSETASRNRFQRFWRAVPVFIFLAVKWKVLNGQTKI